MKKPKEVITIKTSWWQEDVDAFKYSENLRKEKERQEEQERREEEIRMQKWRESQQAEEEKNATCCKIF